MPATFTRNQKISQLIYVKKPAIQLKGPKLSCRIDQYPSRKHNYFVATVRDVVGQVTDPGIDVLEVLESMDIVSEFPEEVLKEAEQVPDAPPAKDLEGRLDLREEITHNRWGRCQRLGWCCSYRKLLKNGNFELGDYIADVSYYVQEG